MESRQRKGWDTRVSSAGNGTRSIRPCMMDNRAAKRRCFVCWKSDLKGLFYFCAGGKTKSGRLAVALCDGKRRKGDHADASKLQVQ